MSTSCKTNSHTGTPLPGGHTPTQPHRRLARRNQNGLSRLSGTKLNLHNQKGASRLLGLYPAVSPSKAMVVSVDCQLDWIGSRLTEETSVPQGRACEGVSDLGLVGQNTS